MINYGIIDRSITFYEKQGFNRIESPWAVSPQISAITKPAHIPDNFVLNHTGKVLVASGEQSFLYLYVKGFLPKGKFQTVTPCFRNEMFDLIHTKYFIKNELIQTDGHLQSELIGVIDHAYKFFLTLGFEKNSLNIVANDTDGWDIDYEGIELGSYGIRSCDFLDWIYGTGVAEPRCSAIMRKYGIPQQTN